MTSNKKSKAAKAVIWNFESDVELADMTAADLIESIIEACDSITMTLDDIIDICRTCADELKRREQSH